jgi:hypothetical protein
MVKGQGTGMRCRADDRKLRRRSKLKKAKAIKRWIKIYVKTAKYDTHSLNKKTILNSKHCQNTTNREGSKMEPGGASRP